MALRTANWITSSSPFTLNTPKSNFRGQFLPIKLKIKRATYVLVIGHFRGIKQNMSLLFWTIDMSFCRNLMHEEGAWLKRCIFDKLCRNSTLFSSCSPVTWSLKFYNIWNYWQIIELKREHGQMLALTLTKKHLLIFTILHFDYLSP